MRIVVDHLTEYRYERPVGFGEHSLYLRPRESQTIHVASFELVTDPEGKVRWVRDCFNNVVAVLSFGLAEACFLSKRNQPPLPPPKFVFNEDSSEQVRVGRAVDSMVCPGSITSWSRNHMGKTGVPQ